MEERLHARRVQAAELYRQASRAGAPRPERTPPASTASLPGTPTCAQLTPAKRGTRPANDAESTQASSDDGMPDERRRWMTWAQRRKRVFKIDVNPCMHCGGALRIVASIEDPKAIHARLAHFAEHGALEAAHYRPGPRGPPAAAA